MKKEFKDFVEELKNGLNDFITPETSKENIDKIASFSSIIDNITAEYQSVKDEYGELKDDYIKIVKNQSFRSDHDPREDDIGGQKSIAEITDDLSSKY